MIGKLSGELPEYLLFYHFGFEFEEEKRLAEQEVIYLEDDGRVDYLQGLLQPPLQLSVWHGISDSMHHHVAQDYQDIPRNVSLLLFVTYGEDDGTHGKLWWDAFSLLLEVYVPYYGV